LGLRISQHWGRHPHWFAGLSKDIKVQLVADHRLRNETQKEYDNRKKMYNNQEIQKRIDSQRAKHGSNN